MSEPSVLAGLGLLVAVVAVLGYLRCLRRSRIGPWPLRRTAGWLLGVATAYGSALLLLPAHPMARPEAHMLGHLGLAMVAPLLLVTGAPVTLVLRSVPVRRGRALVRFLHRTKVRWLVHPVVAALLDVGGLWLLYSTPLITWAHASAPMAVLVILHLLTAGYLFTAAVIGVDPLPRYRPMSLRATVLVVAAAAHAVLAKHLYAGTPVVGDQRAAMIMYYGGDVVEVALLIILGARWSRWRRRSGGLTGSGWTPRASPRAAVCVPRTPRG